MGMPLDEDFNDIPTVTVQPTHGSHAQPKQAKGGVYAPADVKLIKNALLFYVKHNGNITDAEESQSVNLLHRLNRI